MANRKTFATGALASAGLCTLILACSNSSTPSSPTTGSTPPGTTPVTTAPYTTCIGTPLGEGVYTAAGTYATPATTSCTPAGAPATGTADAHCAGQPPQAVDGASCSVTAAGTSSDAASPPADAAGAGSGTEDAGSPSPAPGPCGENGSDYGPTMFGTEGDDDDCKYHVSYTVSPICENNGTYFVVTATHL